MGYANALPYSFLKFNQNDSYVDSMVVTSVASDQNLGTLITPDWKEPLSHAYAEFSCVARRNSNAAANYLTDTNLGGITLDDGVNPVISLGIVPRYTFYVSASGTFAGDMVNLINDVATTLKPNTTYTIEYANATALGNDLYLYVPRICLNLYFGMG